MKRVWMFASMFFLSDIACSAFYSIQSQRELDRKLHDYDYAVVCFSHDDDTGKKIKEHMRYVSYFFQADHTIVFLFVRTDFNNFSEIYTRYGYVGIPLFLVMKHDQVLTRTDLGGHYTTAAVKRLLYEYVPHVKTSYDDDYDGDIEYERKRTVKEMTDSGYTKIDLTGTAHDQKQEYWWNRGHGVSTSGRGGKMHR